MNRHIENNKDQMRNSLMISAAGLCCSLGYHLDAVVCALRANMDHFQESTFYSAPLKPLNVAMLPDEIYGSKRLQLWTEFAIGDCAKNMAEPLSLFDTARTILVILAPDAIRARGDEMFYRKLAQDAMAGVRATMMPSSIFDKVEAAYRTTVFMEGRIGLAKGLIRAAQHLANHEAEQILLIAADSYINTTDINFYLNEARLFTDGNNDGFIPGEAAAALLLTSAMMDADGLHVKGIGTGEEIGRVDGSTPSRAQGLTQAIRAALNQAKFVNTDIAFRISDQNGEQFYSNEGANAITRVMFGAQKLTQLTLADKIGEVGAASGPAMLAWLQREMGHHMYSPGSTGLIHLASDNGTRCAIVVHQHGDT
ncbi:hypothetical protein [Massilia rubra]|uniref:3-oxoacyl-ACP synthase n=1 Tax=Massilia rubra TaxID=2607910 RepID=A0ABX0M1R1_9BURK|nr:hypothetical protein [Massilia rubra]NHZ38475.1 hypothetical protein [Massilia rubra]